MDRHVTSGRGGVHVVFSIVNSLVGEGVHHSMLSSGGDGVC